MKTKTKKKKRGTVSLRMRYTVIFSLIIVLCFNLLGVSLTAFSAHYWYSRSEDLLSENVRNVATSASQLLSGGFITMYGSSDYSIAMLCSSLGLVSKSISADVFICDTSGHVIMCRDLVKNGFVVADGYCPIHSELVISGNILEKSIVGAYSGVSKLDGQYESWQYIVGEPVEVYGQTVAVVYALAPVNESIVSFVLPIIKLFFAAACIAIIIAFLAVYRMAYNFTKPLKRISNATKSYAMGDFSVRINLHRSDEIGQLADSFNSMAGSLAQLESSRRSFVANVSHELKTPMTTIGGFIDGILDGTIEQDKQEYYLRIVSAEVKRLSRMVVAMLNLSKIEAGQLDIKFCAVDVSDMLLTTLLTFEKAIDEKHIDVRGLDLLVPHFVRADLDMFSQAVYNLVDNAVKFTPEGGYINVTVSEDDETVETRILNSGAGIAADELDKVFERFYKVDKSRSYDKKSTGLGLYIVKSIFELYGGTVCAQSEEGRYTEFIFKLPKEM